MQSLSGALLSIQSTSSDLLRSSRSTSASKLSGLTVLLSLTVRFMDYIYIGTGFTTMRRETTIELLQLCEAVSVSYLDEVEQLRIWHTLLDLSFSNTTTGKVLALLKKAWYRFKTDKYSLQGKLPEGATGA
ncbi:hypothetical protein SASPL_129787 [Salvia splendens]|uniref:Uncharacterized protein n=1 Tax=Salvia splendens TaxID=180675 RepID=A0A8X8ZP13_SALSN|nr:hypothetical protein SASPL_129787 [Salvia splendens]